MSGGQTRLVTPPAIAAAISRFERAFVLVARLAQARRQVDQAGRDDAGRSRRCVRFGVEVGGDVADRDDRVPAAMTTSPLASMPDGRIDQAAVLDQ